MDRVDQVIRSIDIKVRRDFELESAWSYNDYKHMVEEALSHHCPKTAVSDLLKLQLSQLYHQGYVVIENIAVSVPVSSVLSVLENIGSIGNGRGKLRNISNQLGFDVMHTHFGQSSFIVENWANHARRTKLKEKCLDIETMYQSLIESISNNYKTGEWVVFSKLNGSITVGVCGCIKLVTKLLFVNFRLAHNKAIKVTRYTRRF